MSSDFHTPPYFPLVQLEKLVYSENREATYNELFPRDAQSAQKHFMLSIFSQLELEQSFQTKIHEKYKSFHKYLSAFEKWSIDSLGAYTDPRDDISYKKIHSKHQLLQLQQVLIDFGASDDEVEQLNIFHESSIENLRALYSYFHSNESIHSVGEDNEYILASKHPIVTNSSAPKSSAPSLQILVRPDAQEQSNQRFIFFSQMVETMSLYYTHSMPEQGSATGFNTFSHLLLNQFVSNHITTTLPANPSNPIIEILSAYNQAIEHPEHASEWLSSFTPNSYPLVLKLIEAQLIDYNELTFFPSLQHLLNTPFIIDTAKEGDKHIIFDLIVYHFEFANEIQQLISSLSDGYCTERKHKYFIYYSNGLNYTWGDLDAHRELSYDQLLIIQRKMKTSVHITAQPTFLESLLTKFVPINFLTLRNNQDVGVLDPYKQSAATSSIGFYPTRHVLDTPIIILKAGELETKKSMIPSFLLTTISIYDQLLQIIQTARKAAGSDDMYVKLQLDQYYYTCLASYLHYTSQNKVWRFDLFNQDFIIAPLVWHGYLYERKGTIFKSKNEEPTIYLTQSNIPSQLFPYISAEDLIDSYIRQYYSLPFVTNWKHCDVYVKFVLETELQSKFFDIKVKQSHVIVDMSCDQSSVLSNTVQITSLSAINDQLTNVQSQLNKSTTFMPTLSIFNNRSNFEKESKAIKNFLSDSASNQDLSYYVSSPQNDTSSLLNWSSDTHNKYVIDAHGNIRTTLDARNLTNITVNIYHLDIFTYYQSHLGKSSGNDNTMEVDPNIDLEGLIPHYTSTIDLSAKVQAPQDIKPWQKYSINLCLDNLPTRGVFMLEVLNGQDGIRCCVRKGMYNTIMKPINAGTLVLVLNEAGQAVSKPRIYIGTDVFKPMNGDQEDTIDVSPSMSDDFPNTESADAKTISSKFIFIPSYDSTKTLLLTDKSRSFASTAILEPVFTSFSLSCDWFASVEALTSNTTPTNDNNDTNTVVINGVETNLRTGSNTVIGGGNMGAEIVLKPILQKDGKIVDLSTITIVKSTLSISAELESGVTITDQIDNFSLTPQVQVAMIDMADGNENNVPAQEILHAFNVPNNLCKLTFRLNCTVEFEGKEHDLASSHSQIIANINKTALSAGMILLRRVNGIYFAYTVDKTGAPIPFVPLRFTYSSQFTSNSSTYSLHSDLNGCVELGTLFGVTDISLGTTTNEYTFIRTQFSFSLLPYQRTLWASSINVIVDDASIDKTPHNAQSITIEDAQVNLPLPLGFMFDSAMVDLLIDCEASKLSQYHITSTNNPFKLSTPPSIAQQNKILEFALKYGAIRFYEKTAQGSVRQLCHQLMTVSPSSIQIYGLKPNRRYHLETSLFGETYSTSIRTFRNPLTRPVTIPQQSFGMTLPQPLFFDTTLNLIFDYLITTSTIYQIKDYSKQLSLHSYNYDSTNETMTIQLTNFNPKTTKLAVLATTLITTIPNLINMYANEQTQFYTQVANSVNDSARTVKDPSSSAFITGTTISGEREYVSLRRDLIKTMQQVGIMLPQPSLLLNKRLRQNTDAIIDKPKEQAKSGATMSLAKERAHTMDEEEEKEEVFSDRKKSKKCMVSHLYRNGASPGGISSSNSNFPIVSSDNNFIATDIMKYKSSFLFNLSPNDDGKVVIKRNGLNKYTSLAILAYETKSTLTNNYGFNSFIVDIPQPTTRLPCVIQPLSSPNQNVVNQSQQPPFVLDNAFTLTLQPHKQYTEEHRCAIIQPTVPLYTTVTTSLSTPETSLSQLSTVIGPNNTVELEIMTSRQDLYAMLSSLLQSRTTAGTLLPRRSHTGNAALVQTALNKFRFLQEWNDFNDAMKLTMLDRHACHELHLFILFNDRAFFESSLRLHLSNKLTKDVVDLWLLSQAIVPLSTLHSGLSTAQVQAVQDNVEIFNAIKDNSRAQLISYSTAMAKYNVFEKILILAVSNPKALHSLALQVQHDVNINPSLSRNNLAYVTIFESCLRRTMLRLNTASPDAAADDSDDGDEDDGKDKPEDIEDSTVYASDTESESDNYWDKDKKEEEDADCGYGYGKAAPDLCPPPPPCTMMKCAAPPPPPPPPPPPCSAPIGALSSGPPMPLSSKQSLSRSIAAPVLLSCKPSLMSAIPMKKRSAITIDSLAQDFSKANKPSSIPSYKPLEKTGEYEERTWYNDAQFDGQRGWTFNSSQAVQWSTFWVDFALYLSDSSRFSINNDNSSVALTNKAFASSAVLELIEASETEYLLCLAVTQLSPTPLAKQALFGTAKGVELSTPLYNYLATAHNSTTADASVLGNVQQGAKYRFVRHTVPKYPIVILHKQVQQLSAATPPTITTVHSKDSTAKSLSAAQYYIDIFETIQKGRSVYVSTEQMFKRRAYLCKTVISNMSPESISSKVLVTIPDGSTSLSYTPSDNHRNGSNQTHLNTLTTRTIYCSIPAYSSYIIQYSFLLGNRDQYTHYGATVTSTNSAISQLYCFVPSLSLKCSDYKQIVNRRDYVTIAREGSEDELCEFLTDYYFNNQDDTANLAASLAATQEGAERQRFDLNYLLFRFNMGSVSLKARFALYMRVYRIVKGWLINNPTSSETHVFISYMYYFMVQSYSPTAAQSQGGGSPLHISKEHTVHISHAFAYLMDSHLRSTFSFTPWQHLEYLPLVAARIHNSSIAPNAAGSNKSADNKDPFIPDRQLKDQYIATLQYTLVHSSNVASIPYQQLLSLIYYAIVLNQNIRVVSLLKHLLNTLSAQPVPNVTTRVQLAYMLIYIDVSTYGTLQTVLTPQQLAVLNTIYKTTNFTQVKDVGYKQTTYAVALLLAREYQRYPIKQWKLLFVQTLQYLKEGQVIVSETATTIATPTSPSATEISDKDVALFDIDFDPNVAGASVAQRDLRQDQSSNFTPTLSCSVQQTLTHTNVLVSFSNLAATEKSLTFDVHYIDSELLLSHKPFMTSQQNNQPTSSSSQQQSKQSDQITKPHLSLHIPLPLHTLNQPGVHTITVPIPSHLSKEAQLTIVASETQITSATPLLHSAFVVQILSKQGIVSVLDSRTHKPISGVYVKCYLEGSSPSSPSTFHHDCYTDLRGKADYASSSNSSKSANNQSFGIIISHPQYGTTVSYTRGPQF